MDDHGRHHIFKILEKIDLWTTVSMVSIRSSTLLILRQICIETRTRICMAKTRRRINEITPTSTSMYAGKVTVLGQLFRQATWRSQLGICLSYQCHRPVEDHDSVAAVRPANSLVTSTVLTSSTAASSAPRLMAPHFCSPISQLSSTVQPIFCETIILRTDDLHFQRILSRLLQEDLDTATRLLFGSGKP